MSQNPEWLMSNPIGSRYSLCQQNKFTIQMRSYHVITFYKTVLPGTSISSYTRFSTLRTHDGDYQHRVILTKPSPILFCLMLRMRFIWNFDLEESLNVNNIMHVLKNSWVCFYLR